MNTKKLRNRYIAFYCATVALIACSLYFYIRSKYNTELHKLEESKKNRFNVLQVGLKANLFSLMTDLKIISGSSQIKNLVNHPGDPGAAAAVNEFFELYEESSGFYDQIRFIDRVGQEICRVNYTNAGEVVIIPKEKLQNKSGRYYFQDAIKLGPNEIFISPLDLNKEHGKIEEPHKPVIRIATPVFNDKGEKRGVVILNYLAKKMLESFHHVAADSYGEIMLLNGKGYILACNDDCNTFGFMYPRNSDAEEARIHIEELIDKYNFKQSSTLQVYTEDEGLLTVKRILIPRLLGLQNRILQHFSGPEKWYIYSHISPAELSELTASVKQTAIPLMVLVFAISAIGFYWRYTMLKKNMTLKRENEDAVKRFAEKMKEQYDYLQFLMDALPFPFYVIDAETYRIVLANKAAGNVEVNVSTCHKVTHQNDEPCNSPEHGCPLNIVKKTGKTAQIEHLHKTEDGKDNYFLVHGIPIFDDAGKVKQMIEFSVDINDRKMVEIALQDAKQKAEEANRAKSSFLAMMSHEIRTPMNGIMGMAELIEETDLDDEQRDFVNTIKVSAESLLTIINDVLDFSKIEANKIELEETPVHIPKLIESVYELLAPKAAEKDIELLYMLAQNVPVTILGDEVRLRQILINLANNSLKFTDSGEIIIKVSMVQSEKDCDGVTLQFDVRDTGIGISEENLHKLFQAFSQEDASTTRKYGGTGLGLAISKRLVDLMHGRIWVDTEKGVGSTFSFTVKTKVADTIVDYSSSKQTMQLVNKRVLFVDDNATNRKIVDLQLRSWGIKSTVVDSAFKAEELLIEKKEVFDLVILDYSMPDKNGVELAGTLRHKGFTVEKLPLMLLSSVGVPTVKNKHLFNKVLLKPLKQELFYKAVCGIFESKTGKRKKSDNLKEDSSLNVDFAKSFPGKILLAEDNKINQKLALKILEKLGYLNIAVAENGKIAVEKVANGEFDLVFMDMQMPEMDGPTAAEEIRKFNKDIIIIAMTANAMGEDKDRCLKAGMNDHISKPISIGRIKKALAEYMSKSK